MGVVENVEFVNHSCCCEKKWLFGYCFSEAPFVAILNIPIIANSLIIFIRFFRNQTSKSCYSRIILCPSFFLGQTSIPIIFVYGLTVNKYINYMKIEWDAPFIQQ